MIFGLLCGLLVAQRSDPGNWSRDGSDRWTYGMKKSNLAYIVKDGSGYWGFDTRFNRSRLVAFASTLQSAEQEVESKIKLTRK